MKKITLAVAALLATTGLFSQSTYKWYGTQTDQVWDYATANWLDPSFPVAVPRTFAEGSNALFDDTSVEGSDTIKIVGNVTVDSIKINAAKYYFFNYTNSTDFLSGLGALEKKGTGTLEINLPNTLKRGTTIYAGKIQMQNAGTTPNIFGDTLKFESGTVNLGTSGSTSSKKVTFQTPIIIQKNKTANIELARYSYLGSKIIGEGEINLLCAGERTFLGYESLPSGILQLQPDWSEFTGSLKISKLLTSTTPGFWGLLLNTSRTFKDSLNGFNIDSTLYRTKVKIMSGATLATHSGVKAWAIGELSSEDSTAYLCGYRSASNGPRSYYFVGGLNTDVVYPGKICQAPGITSHYTHVAFIKMGTGTYTFTNNNNDIIGGVIVREGGLLINDKNLRGNYRGGVGNYVIVEKNGTIGGTGRIMGNLDVYGKLEPGSNGIGTLSVSDSLSAHPVDKYDRPVGYSFTYKNTSAANTTFSYKNGGSVAMNVTLYSGSVSEFDINSASSYDKVVASGKLKFGPDTVGLGKPKIKILLSGSYNINDGDKFEIIKTKSLDASSMDFDIEYPDVPNLTWSVETKYDTVAVDKETYTFTDHVVTQTNADSVATNVITMDSVIVNYKVIVTAHGSAQDVKNVTISSLSVYPNPSTGEFNFSSSDSEIKSIDIINLQGQIIKSEYVNSKFVKLNLGYLPQGIYYAKINTAEGIKVKKLMLQ